MLKLRDHQTEVVEKLRDGFAAGHRCQLLYAPTGFGKTEVAMYVMKEAADKYKSVAMILDRVVLVNQTSARLSKYQINHGVMQADHWRYRPMERIQICSAQTLESRQNFPKPNLLIIDECHIQRKQILQYVRDNPDMQVIGLTATPFTDGLGDTYTHVVGAKSTGDMIASGWLTPLKVFIAKEIDMTGAKKVAGEWSPNEVTERGMQLTGDIVAEWEKKTYEVFGKPAKTVVFCSGVEHGRDLVRQFNERGYNFVSISYKEDGEYKTEMIEDFSRPDTNITGLIATDILTKGFDVPDVMIGVAHVHSPSRSALTSSRWGASCVHMRVKSLGYGLIMAAITCGSGRIGTSYLMRALQTYQRAAQRAQRRSPPRRKRQSPSAQCARRCGYGLITSAALAGMRSPSGKLLTWQVSCMSLRAQVVRRSMRTSSFILSSCTTQRRADTKKDGQHTSTKTSTACFPEDYKPASLKHPRKRPTGLRRDKLHGQKRK